MSLYGHANRTSPFLEDFAEDQATIFEQARAPAARSLDSHVSILTGFHAEAHQVTSHSDRLAPGHTVFEWLAREHGYRTGVFSENSWLTEVDVGIKDAFDTVEGPRNVPFTEAVDPTQFVIEHGQGAYWEFVVRCLRSDTPVRSLLNGLAIKLGSDHPAWFPGQTTTPGVEYVDFLLDWIGEVDGPWAACLNLMDAHHPYRPEPQHDHWGGDELRALQDEIDDVKWEFNGGQRPWWQRRALEGLYDGAIRQLDAALERLISGLAERTELDGTLMVITSDHGEGFGEPSLIRPGVRVASHSVSIHEVVLHVPLVLKPPGSSASGRVADPVSLVDFPAAVENVVADNGSAVSGFDNEKPVLSTAFGLDDPVRERARRYCSDLDSFTGRSRAAYELTGDTVRKRVTRRDHAREVVVHDAQTSYSVERDTSDIEANTRSAFEYIQDAGIRQTGSGMAGLPAASYRRLEDLGYV